MLVFLWLVQIIIYPSFKKISGNHPSWYKSYQTSLFNNGTYHALTNIWYNDRSYNSISLMTVIRFILLTLSWLLQY